GDLVGEAAELARQLGELAAVVAVWTADHDDRVTLCRQTAKRLLPVLGRLADRVDEAYVRVGEASAGRFDQVQKVVERVGGRGDDAKARPAGKLLDIFFVQNNRVFVEIAHEAANLYVSGLANHDRMAALSDEPVERQVNALHQRTSRVVNLQTLRAQLALD